MLRVDMLAIGVDNQKQVIAEVGDDQVVNDAAAPIGEKRITLPPWREAENVCGHKMLEGVRRI